MADFDLLPTPNPNEDALVIWVDRGTALGLMGRYQRGVTTLEQFELASCPLSEGQAGWVFMEKLDPDAQGRLGFLFVKVRSAEEINTPIEEFTIEDEEFVWPKILEDLKVYCDNPAPKWTELLTNKQKYLFVRKKRERPRFRGATQIIVRRFWSHVPWAGVDFASEPMQPNDVENDLAVIFISVKDCLHGLIKIPGLAGSGGMERLYNLSDDDPGADPIAAYPARTFLPTNYETWEDHIFRDTQRPLRGGYLREQLEALAPPLTDIEET